MWNPISIDKFVKIHLKKNPGENEKVIRARIEAQKTHPRGDYEIDSALDKRDKYGRRNIDEMDPRKIAGIFDDDGYEISERTLQTLRDNGTLGYSKPTGGSKYFYRRSDVMALFEESFTARILS
jgi:hypothetical protein